MLGASIFRHGAQNFEIIGVVREPYIKSYIGGVPNEAVSSFSSQQYFLYVEDRRFKHHAHNQGQDIRQHEECSVE